MVLCLSDGSWCSAAGIKAKMRGTASQNRYWTSLQICSCPLSGLSSTGYGVVDTVLPFGLSSAPKIVCAITDALEWILYQCRISSSLHYLDDFLTIDRPNSDRSAANLQLISVTYNYLGLPLKNQKVEGPTTSLTLGIILDPTRSLWVPPRSVKLPYIS